MPRRAVVLAGVESPAQQDEHGVRQAQSNSEGEPLPKRRGRVAVEVDYRGLDQQEVAHQFTHHGLDDRRAGFAR